MKNYNLVNWALLIFFVIMICIDLNKEAYVTTCCDGFLAIFNMFLILIYNQRTIMTKQDEQKEREEKIIKMLNEKGE